MTHGHSIDKRRYSNKQPRENSGPAQFFRPLSPFAPSESSEDEQLPDWARPSGVQRRPRESTTYNFDWISSSDPERPTSSAEHTHRDLQQSPPRHSPPAPEGKLANSEPARSDGPDDDTDIKTSLTAETIAEHDHGDMMHKDDPLALAIEHISASTPEQTLKTARALTQDGNMEAALGHYLYLVKSDQKLKQVVADLEAQRANPHVTQTPLMLQTLADAYTKTRKLSKALPLYRQALGR